jgi:hypothetical protein
LNLLFNEPLRGSGGALPISLLPSPHGLATYECMNCYPARLVVSGPVNGIPVPVPAAIWLFGSAVAAGLGLARRGKAG